MENILNNLFLFNPHLQEIVPDWKDLFFYWVCFFEGCYFVALALIFIKLALYRLVQISNFKEVIKTGF
jgi:hypothetical protein